MARPLFEQTQSNKLFEAFLAGFDASGEGFNGEYVGERYRGTDGDTPAFTARMRHKFDLWMGEKSMHLDPGGPMTDSDNHLTTDRTDPRLGHGPNDEPVPQNEAYLVLSDEERAKGFERPYRAVYVHEVCGTETRMGRAIAETYARQPTFYGATYCVHCSKHRPVGPKGEFVWLDGSKVGS